MAARDPKQGPELFLITGFLGSGKTTLLRQVLTGPDAARIRTAVLVNEFGEVGIDGDLLADLPVPVTELANGCICCSMRYGLVKAMTTILQEQRPERLIIEASGIADPGDILTAIHESDLAANFRFCKVITVLSADLWEDRDMFGPIFFNQIQAADLLLINKIDLLPGQAINRYPEEIRQVNSHCAIHATSRCRISPDLLWRPPAASTGRPSPLAHQEKQEEKGPTRAGYGSFSFINDIPFKNDCFRRFIGDLPDMLYRVKGFARLEDSRFFFQYSNGQCEWLPTAEPGPTKLIFVGANLNQARLVAELQQCLTRHHSDRSPRQPLG